MLNAKGYSLLEVLLALFCLTIATMFIFPAFLWIHEETKAIQRHSDGLKVLEEAGQQFLHFGEFPSVIQVNDTVYEFTRHSLQNETFELCVQWTGKNERKDEVCLLAKR
ncbi:type II secretion system protein [Halalkalibacterium ligniniphilum]|uniref:type II secretion system protein n=1 Tax=Halalkalibacterium ligniniphilum TaxID=1134413 RepID=UPI0003493CDE|nr:type II secretion system protein [Halalkalibacterium ligniniphilum]